MSDSICVPSEDVREHVENALREMSRAISNKVREHLEAAHDDEAFTVTLDRAREAISDNGWDVDDLDIELSLDEVTRAIDSNGWGFDDLDIKPDLDAVRSIVQEEGWSASQLEIASTDISECVGEHGTHDVLRSLLDHDENGAVAVAQALWSLLKPNERDAFLAKVQPAAQSVDLNTLDKLREDITTEVRAHMMSKLSMLLG